MRNFIDGFKSRSVWAYFDVGNVLLTGYPDQWLRILGRRVRRVPVKDFKTAAGTASGFCDLLEGDVDFEAERIYSYRVGGCHCLNYLRKEKIIHDPAAGFA